MGKCNSHQGMAEEWRYWSDGKRKKDRGKRMYSVNSKSVRREAV
jgi:hypothetical protein